MIAIVDYGLGNVSAFLNVYKRLGIEACAVSTAESLEAASKIILPGVGAFDHAMALIASSGMRDALDHLVLRRGVPVLGVCVGMQILAGASDEGGSPGLGWIDGHVKSLGRIQRVPMPLPHMGWNTVLPSNLPGLFAGLGGGSRFYFLHSYYFSGARREDVAATSEYGAEFCCAISSRNIHGVQFHPEKSHQNGALLLKNFASL